MSYKSRYSKEVKELIEDWKKQEKSCLIENPIVINGLAIRSKEQAMQVFQPVFDSLLERHCYSYD